MIKEVNKISCRIYLDLENGYVAVENVSDTMIDAVIELVDNYYTILGVDIDNTFEENTEKQVAPVVEDSTTDTTDDAVDETVEEVAEETAEVVVQKQPTVLEPQSEDDLIIKKVEFENELVENRINSFLKTAYWAMYNRRATEKDISEYILTCMSEISMRFSSKPIIEFSIGDIVDVNYGSHLPGEIMGGHVHAIVCNVLNEDMAYVVPITKVRADISSLSYLFMDAPQDATYNNEYYKGGTVLFDKGKYVRVERFNAVIGRTNPEFFEKLLYQLASAFDFTNCLTETVEDDSDLPFTMGETADEVVETSTATEETPDEVVETATTTEETADEVVETSTATEETADEVVETATATEETPDEVVETATATEETPDEVVETSTATEETADEVVETSTATEETPDNVVKTKTPAKKVGGEESALLEVIGFAFDKLDSSKKVEEQIESFLNDIGMTTTERMVTNSFIIACDIKKINYENVLLGLHELFPTVKEEIIKNILKEAFKNWLDKYPTLAEKCPKISLMAVLKVFAKRFA